MYGRGLHPFTLITQMTSSLSPQRGALAYVGVAFAALLAALISVLNASTAIPGAAAYVNGVPIPQAEYSRAVNAMQAGLERPLTKGDKARALERLIDEELIVQEAVKLGLPSTDRLVRKNLVQGMLRSVTSLETGSDNSEAALRQFFNDNQGLFSTPKVLSLYAAKVTNGADAEAFLKALEAGQSFENAIKAGHLDLDILPQNIPLGKVSGLLGGAAAQMAAQMKVGDIAGPVTSNGSDVFMWLISMSGGSVEFDDAKGSISAELLRRQEEAALEDYLSRLRVRARIRRDAE